MYELLRSGGGIGYTTESAHPYFLMLVSLSDTSGRRVYLASREVSLLTPGEAVYMRVGDYHCSSRGELRREDGGCVPDALRDTLLDIFDDMLDSTEIDEERIVWVRGLDEGICGVAIRDCSPPEKKYRLLADYFDDYLTRQGLDINNIWDVTITKILNLTTGSDAEFECAERELPDMEFFLSGDVSSTLAAKYGVTDDTLRCYREICSGDGEDCYLCEESFSYDFIMSSVDSPKYYFHITRCD